MTHVITSLCLGDGACVKVCPVDCIVNGADSRRLEEWPQYYIDPVTCIDCGACVPACPFEAIFTEDELPATYVAVGGERLNLPASALPGGEAYAAEDSAGRPVRLAHTRRLSAGEAVDLSGDLERNADFFVRGPGYRARPG